MSFSSAAIPWHDHVRWFQEKLADPCCHFFLATDSEEVPVGQVRYDLQDAEAVISISLARHQRSRGYGSALLRCSAHQLFSSTSCAVIHAYVKQENQASARAFERAGYTNTGTAETKGQVAVHLTLEKHDVTEGRMR